MPETSWEHAAEARAALNAIVSDPEHGVAALSSAQTMSNLLKDLLPDAPREKSILVAAAEAGLADALREHVVNGMDASTAIRLTASSFATSTPFTPDACTWVAAELASVLGISQGVADSVGPGSPTRPLQADDQAGMPTQIAQIPGFGSGAGPAVSPDVGQAPQQAYPAQAAPQGFQQAPQSGGQAYPTQAAPQGPQSPGQAYPTQAAPQAPQSPRQAYQAQGAPQGFPQAPQSPGQAYPTQAAPQGYQAGYGQPGGYAPGMPAGGYGPGAAAPPGGYGPGTPAGGGFGTPMGGYGPGVQAGGYGPGGPGVGFGPGGPGPGGRIGKSGRKRGLLIVGGILAGIVVIIVVAASLSSSGKPSAHGSGSPSQSLTPTTTPSTSTPSTPSTGVESLSTIMNPQGFAPVGTSCNTAQSNGLNPATISNSLYCTSTSINFIPTNHIVVWAYQFDSHSDYQSGFAKINSITGFKSSGAISSCSNPTPTSSQFGSTTWHALHNPKYSHSQGQYLECFTEYTKTHKYQPLLIWAMPTNNVVFISRNEASGGKLTQLYHWWAHLNYG